MPCDTKWVLFRSRFHNANVFLFAFSGAGIRAGSLPPDRQAPAMPETPIGPQVNQPFDILTGFPSEITLNPVILLNDRGEKSDLLIREVLSPPITIDLGFGQNLTGHNPPYPVKIRQGGLDPLFSGYVDT